MNNLQCAQITLNKLYNYPAYQRMVKCNTIEYANQAIHTTGQPPLVLEVLVPGDVAITYYATEGSVNPSSAPNLYRGILQKSVVRNYATPCIFAVDVLMLLTIPGCNLSPRCL